MPTAEIKFKMTRNSLAGLIRFLIAFPVLFFMTPFILQKLGSAQFGVWALIGVAGAVIQLSEFGMNITLIKFVAELTAQGEDDSLNSLVSTAMVIQGLMAALLATPIIVFRQTIVVRVLQVPTEYASLAAAVLVGSVGVYAVRIVLNVFTATLTGFQRMDISHSLSLLATMCNAIGVYISLKIGWGLAGLVIASAGATFIFGISAWGTVRLIFPDLHLKFRYWRCDIAKKMFVFGWPVQVSYLSGLGLTPLHKLILTQSAGVDAVTHYEIANQVSSQVRGLFVQTILPVIPAASALHTTYGRVTLWRVYRRVWRYLWIFAFPIFVFVFLIAERFITAWLGGTFPQAVFALQVFLVAQWFSLLVTPLYFMLQGIGLVRHTMMISVLTGGFSALFSLIFGHLFGFHGVVLGFGVTFVFSSGLTYWIFQSKVHGSYRQLVQVLGLQNFIILSLMGLGLWGTLHYWLAPKTLIEIGALGIGFLILYGLGLFFGRALRKDDILPLQGILPTWLYEPLIARFCY
jgi:O-antigen/teichoic acid export membrane protein